MAIYRGPGGAGDATGDATNASALALAAKDEAQASATAAANSATAAAASATSAANDAASASSSATSAAISRTAAAASATQAESVLSTAVKLTGDQTVAGVKTFSSTIAGSINGNAATVTNGVYTTGDQTIAGTKTFSSTIAGSINGNAATVTNGVYTTGDQTIAGTKTFLSTISGSINGSASTATSATTATTATNVSGGTASVTTLTTSSTVTHNGGTANRLTYLNGSKVLSTSDILVFDGANLGLNVTPPTSVSSSGGIYLANTANIAATGPYLHFGANYYYVLTTPKYTSTAPAAIYSSYNGTHLWRVAPSGTADATITWTTALTLDANADMYLPKNFYIGDASNTSSQISSGSSSNPLIFGINGTEKARIDTSGNFGLGVTPSSWGSTYAKPIQLGNKGAAVSGFTSSYSVTPYANVSVNAYFASDATWKYFDGGYGASLYQQQANEHRWSIAGTGTTGSSITFTQAMTLDASGRLLIGTTTASSMLTVAGTITSKAGGQGLSLSPSTTTNAAYMTATNGAGTSYIGIDDSAGNAFGAAYATFLIGGGARPLLLGTNGSERARIDSSGNLGIGLTPTSGYGALQVLATGSIISAGVQRAVEIYDAGSGSGEGGAITFSSATCPAFAAVYGSSTNPGGSLIFATNSANTGYPNERMRIDSSGNFTIGGQTATRLEVNLTENDKVELNAVDSTNTSRNLVFSTGDTERARIDTSGNVGIGTSSPATKLHVAGEIRNSSDLSNSGDPIVYSYNGAAAGTVQSGIQFVGSGQNMRFYTASTERARFDSSGNLLVGTTSSTVGDSAGIRARPDGTLQATRTASTNAVSTMDVYSTGASAYRFYVGMGGTVYASSTSISAISDATLKENVRDLETGLTEVMALRPRRFDWKNGDAQNVAGFVAQEVEQVLPELVTDYVYNKDEDGNDIIKKSLKMGDILPTMVKAIQEQQAIIESLKARLDAANL